MKYIFLFLFFAAISLSANERDRVELTLNCANEPVLPRNFRTTEIQSLVFQSPTQGMSELKASASGQFSEMGLYTLLESIPAGPKVIVDLRQESHCFVNGHAVYWRTNHNWSNRGKSLELIESEEAKRQNELLGIPCIILDAITIHPVTAVCEKTLVEQTGNSYVRIPVTDHRIPSDEAVDQFVTFYRELPADVWVHYHCSAGKGRSSTFMVMHDIMSNGDTLSLKDILRRQGELGGKNFTLTCSSESWKAPYERERMHFIHMFYRYHHETHGSIPWSEWTKNQI